MTSCKAAFFVQKSFSESSHAREATKITKSNYKQQEQNKEFKQNTRIHGFNENNLCDDHAGCDLLSISKKEVIPEKSPLIQYSRSEVTTNLDHQESFRADVKFFYVAADV